MSPSAISEPRPGTGTTTGRPCHVVPFRLAGRLFGMPAETVRRVLTPHGISPIPLAPRAIVGSLNLRGRIVTVIDLRQRLGLCTREAELGGTSIVVEHRQDLYALIVDSTGDAVTLPSARQAAPLDPTLDQCASGVCRMDDQRLVIIDLDRLLNHGRSAAA